MAGAKRIDVIASAGTSRRRALGSSGLRARATLRPNVRSSVPFHAEPPHSEDRSDNHRVELDCHPQSWKAKRAHRREQFHVAAAESPERQHSAGTKPQIAAPASDHPHSVNPA